MAKLELESLLLQLDDEDEELRQEACQKLGKLGDPKAIPNLVTTYELDDNEEVRKEAEKALQVFRIIQAKTIKGEAGGGGGIWGKARIGLIVSLVVLIALNVFFALSGESDEDDGQAAARQALLDQLETEVNTMSIATETLLAEFEEYQQDPEKQYPPANCTKAITLPKTIDLLESDIDVSTFPDIYALFGPGSLYEKHVMYLRDTAFVQRNDKICQAPPIPPDIKVEFIIPSLKVIIDNSTGSLLETLDELRTVPLSEQNVPPPTVPAGPPTDTPLPSLTPTPSDTPTPTMTPTPQYPLHVGYLEAILNDAEFALTTATENWNAIQAGNPQICAAPRLGQARTYALAADQKGDPDLDEAVTLVNEGMELTNTAFEFYKNSCTDPNNAAEGLQMISEAQAKFTAAREKLEVIKGKY